MTDLPQPEWLKNYVPLNPGGNSVGNPNWLKDGPSPNPEGRPKGVVDKRTKLLKRMLDDASDVYDGLLAKAKEGDAASAGLIFARILPTLRAQSQTVQFPFDPALPLSEQLAQVAVAVADGLVSPDTGQQISAILSNLANVRSSENLEERIIALEAKAVG